MKLTGNQVSCWMMVLIVVNWLFAHYYAYMAASVLFWITVVLDITYMVRRERYLKAMYKESKRLFDAGKIPESWDIIMKIGKDINERD